MPSLREHLDSPQFTDANGRTTGESALKVGGNWVKPGVPRWKGYLLYAIAFFGGLALVASSVLLGDGLDLFAFFGLLSMALGVGGTIETLRGRPLTRILGR